MSSLLLRFQYNACDSSDKEENEIVYKSVLYPASFPDLFEADSFRLLRVLCVLCVKPRLKQYLTSRKIFPLMTMPEPASVYEHVGRRFGVKVEPAYIHHYIELIIASRHLKGASILLLSISK